MAKTNVYKLTEDNAVTLMRTLKNVTEVTGQTYSKAEIEEGKVDNLELVEMDLTDEQIDILKFRGSIIEEETDMEDNREEVLEEVAENVEEIKMNIEEILETEDDIDEESVRELEEEEYEDSLDEEGMEDLEDEANNPQEPTTEEDVADLGEALEVLEEDVELDEYGSVEEDIEVEVEDKPSMDDLLAKLQANNAKIAKDNPEKAKTKKAKVELKTDSEGNVVYPEKGYFKDEDTIKKYYKQLDNEQLDEWLEIEGIEYTPNDNPGIDRMRKCMAIREYHFPKENKPSKKKASPYAKYTTEDLVEMALDNDVEVQDAKGNMRILRMYCIMALRKAGIIE